LRSSDGDTNNFTWPWKEADLSKVENFVEYVGWSKVFLQ